MNDHDPLTLLNLRRLPARLDYHGAGALLNFEPVALKALVHLGHLKPLGCPQRNEQKYFATAMLLRLATDEKWLHDATRIIIKYWAQRNGQRQSPARNIRPRLPRRPRG